MGKKDLIDAARLNGPPRGGNIGRGMKVNKEEIIGMYVALDSYIKRDHAGDWKIWDVKPVRWVLALLTFALFSLAVVFFRASTLTLAWERVVAMFGAAIKDAATLAWNGDAKVFVVGLIVGLAVQDCRQKERELQAVLLSRGEER